MHLPLPIGKGCFRGILAHEACIILINPGLRCFNVAFGDTAGASSSLGAEVSRLKSVIAQQFEVYDIRVTYDSVVFFIDCNQSTLEQRFDAVRNALVPQNYIPFLHKRGGEYAITVSKRKPLSTRGLKVNMLFLALTLGTTSWAGAYLWAGYHNESNYLTLDAILNGLLYFVAPVMLILGTHEMGHYVVARRFKVNASMPFFLPSIPPLGTLGAFISIRDPFPNRKALLEIGIAGPIAGFLVSIPVAFLGFYLTMQNPVPSAPLTSGTIVFSVPYLYNLMISTFPFGPDINIFPTAFAAWVGFFATALNLLPVGSLDGGHVARALLGDNSKYLGWATLLGIVVLSFEFVNWILIAFFILLFGVNHPPPLDDVSKLKVNRKMLGVVAVAMFLVSFTPVPASTIPPNTAFTLAPSQTAILMNGTTPQYFNLTVVNTGNVQSNINISQQEPVQHFVAVFSEPGSGVYGGFIILQLNTQGSANVTVKIAVVSGTAAGDYPVVIEGSAGGVVVTATVVVQYT